MVAGGRCERWKVPGALGTKVLPFWLLQSLSQMRTTLFLQRVLKALWIPPSGKICKIEKENKTKPTNKQKKATSAAGSTGRCHSGQSSASQC